MALDAVCFRYSFLVFQFQFTISVNNITSLTELVFGIVKYSGTGNELFAQLHPSNCTP